MVHAAPVSKPVLIRGSSVVKLSAIRKRLRITATLCSDDVARLRKLLDGMKSDLVSDSFIQGLTFICDRFRRLLTSRGRCCIWAPSLPLLRCAMSSSCVEYDVIAGKSQIVDLKLTVVASLKTDDEQSRREFQESVRLRVASKLGTSVHGAWTQK